MNRKELRKFIAEAITEAKAATKTKDPTLKDLLDQLSDLEDTSLETTPDPKEAEESGDTRGTPPVRGIPGVKGFMDLTGPEFTKLISNFVAPEGFDFDQEFEQALSNRDLDLDPYDDLEDEDFGSPEDFGTPADTTTKFQTSQPTYGGEPGVTQRSSGDPSAEIERVLMDEFVAPAMAEGQRLLPVVLTGIAKISKEAGPERANEFRGALQIALNAIRSDEDRFFQKILDVDLGAAYLPPPEEQGGMVSELRNILSQYYSVVIGKAQENKHLLRRMHSIRDRYTDEAFRAGFAKAIQKSRAAEDKIFGSILGEAVDEKPSLSETLLYNSLSDDILLRVSRKV